MKLKGLNICSFDPFDEFGLPKGTRYRQHNNPFVSIINFFENFASYHGNQSAADAAWPTTDTTNVRVNVTNDNLGYTGVRNNTNVSTSRDLGSGSISDTVWTLRWKMNFSVYSSGSDIACLIGLSDSPDTSGSDTAQDFLAIALFFDLGNGYASLSCDGVSPNSIGGGTNEKTDISWATSTDYFFQIERTSATQFVIKIFSDAGYTTQIGTTITATTVATVQSLRYFRVMNRVGSHVGSGSFTTIIDDIAFYNNKNL